MKWCGAPCDDGAVYATDGYGFFCMPRTITERLVEKNRTFEEADAWLDLWCHTVYRDYGNAFSFLAPAIQFRILLSYMEAGPFLKFSLHLYRLIDKPGLMR